MTFARFMEMALYDPEDGYYASGRATIGKAGDFYTNVSVGPVFGWLLARHLEDLWRLLGRPASFSVVEQGANDGQLASDILSVAGGAFAEAMQYVIVEPVETLKQRQVDRLQRSASVRHVQSIEELEPFEGVVFGNELVDAFPFHIMHSTGNGWDELFVSCPNAETFAFTRGRTSAVASRHASELPMRKEGNLAEVRPAADAWLAAIASRMTRGFVIIADYGASREELFSSEKTRGSFACYHNHLRDDDVLTNPGHKDITAHVDFTALSEAAREAGFFPSELQDQHHFLIPLAEPLLKAMEGKPNARFMRQFNTLIHPQLMGRSFKVLHLAKNHEPLHVKRPVLR